MLCMLIKSYDEHFDTFAVSIKDEVGDAYESLIPAALLPYIAPKLCANSTSLCYDAVGEMVVLQHKPTA